MGAPPPDGGRDEVAGDLTRPLFWLVAGARNHLQANRQVEFRFEVAT
jgi:hypothetical protein